MSAAHQSRQRSLRFGTPLWLQTGRLQRRQRYPSLTTRIEADLAIVGGGMTGALVAQTFASSGFAVVVLEANRVARGSTAASSALLLQEPDQGLGELSQRYGVARARRIWQLSQQAVRDFRRLLTSLPESIDLFERDTIYYASTSDAGRQLRDEHSRRLRAGFDAEWMTPGSLRRATGIPGFGAIRTTGNAQFDPYRGCLALLRSASASGADIFERSEVTRIQPVHDGVRVHTARGRVDARRVVLATGYATPHFKPLAGRFRMYRTFVLATARLGQPERREIGLGDVMVWDTGRPYHYARWTADGRRLLGGGDRPARPGMQRSVQLEGASRDLRDHFERVLPALADVDVEAAWEGLFALTPDSLPFIGPHRRYPGHFFALGYGGNGMTFGCLAGRILLEHWRGVRSKDHDLFSFSRFR
jgi:glycine/D-amino acid oxidase-like deaminating enzyme